VFVLEGRFRRFFSNLGPGLITGAADDDPSGISTFSVTGAAFGYTPLWTAIFSFPLMAAVQIMCARLGMVTGLGLAGVIRVRYPRWILWGACALLLVANIVNIAADLGGMADVTELLTGVRAIYWTPAYALLLVSLLFWTSRVVRRLLGHAGRYPGNHHLPIPLFLAGRAGSGGGYRSGQVDRRTA
jgi:Mn2+/Fe2+ NRAMP family transporter